MWLYLSLVSIHNVTIGIFYWPFIYPKGEHNREGHFYVVETAYYNGYEYVDEITCGEC